MRSEYLLPLAVHLLHLLRVHFHRIGVIGHLSRIGRDFLKRRSLLGIRLLRSVRHRSAHRFLSLVLLVNSLSVLQHVLHVVLLWLLKHLLGLLGLDSVFSGVRFIRQVELLLAILELQVCFLGGLRL